MRLTRIQQKVRNGLSRLGVNPALVGDAELAATLGSQTLSVGFGCEGVTISGLEIEVQLGQAGSPIAQLQRRFAAGDYKVSPTLAEAASGVPVRRVTRRCASHRVRVRVRALAAKQI